MTKKNARKGRSDGKKNFLDQLINCGRVEKLSILEEEEMSQICTYALDVICLLDVY